MEKVSGLQVQYEMFMIAIESDSSTNMMLALYIND